MTRTTPTPAAPAHEPSPRRAWWWIAAVSTLALGLLLVLIFLPRWLSSRDVETGTTKKAAAEATRHIHATLFYVSTDGATLTPVDREVDYGVTPAEQARRLIEAEVAPPPTGALSPIPAGTSVRALYLTTAGDAYVDLSHELATAHTGGSLDELLTVYAIVDTLCVNLPDVSSVQILVDGRQVDTLAGHVDLRRPLHKSMAWIRKEGQ